MRLSTRMHGFLDYGLGALVIALPFLMGFQGTVGGWIAILLGGGLIVNALLTNFEAGRADFIEVPLHLWIDGAIGLLLLLSPWILGFDRTVWVPHVATGTLLIVAALLSNTVPEVDRRGSASGRRS